MLQPEEDGNEGAWTQQLKAPHPMMEWERKGGINGETPDPSRSCHITGDTCTHEHCDCTPAQPIARGQALNPPSSSSALALDLPREG